MRLEAEFYVKESLVVGNYRTGREIIPFVQYGTSDELNEDGIGFPVLRLNEFDTMFLGEPAKWCALLDDADYEALKIRKGDVLVCRTNGNPTLVGKAAVALEDKETAFASYLFRVRPNADYLSPEVLCVFLNSKAGRIEIERHSIRSNQVNFSPDKLLQVKIPLFSPPFQQVIEKMVREAFNCIKAEKSNLRLGEQTLLRALGLEGWKPPEPLTYTRRASEAFAAGRFDAEHFLPKFDALVSRIHAQELEVMPLQNLIFPVKNGFDCREFVGEGTPYIRVGDIGQCRINLDSAEKIPLSANEISKGISLLVGDVLFTRKGSYGNAAPVRLGEEHAIISSEIMLIRLKPEFTEKVLPEYLALYFNSIAGAYQAEKWAHGVAFYSVSQEDLNRFLVPLLSISIQEQLRDSLNQAESARRKAHELLERAKRAVEIAIEQSEAAALRYLDQRPE